MTKGLAWFLLISLLVAAPAWPGSFFFVDPLGSDVTGDGSSGNPWASIQMAVDSVPDGAEVIVRSGTYNGRQRIRQRFAMGITVRAEVPYQARFRHDSTVITIFDAEGVTLQGLDIAHDGPGAGALVVQIQDLIDGPDATSRIVLRDNILHDSSNNDVLKINNGARDIQVLGNLFYNQSGSDEHIDINSVEDVVVRGNVFFNDQPAGNTDVTSSYIVIKDSNGTDDAFLGSRNITVAGNVFLNWQGNSGANFVLIGEDGNPFFEGVDVLVENNLMLGNSAIVMRASFGVKGGQNVSFRHNTVIGDLPSNAFAMRLNTEGANPANDNIAFYNNIWADPSQSMNDFSDTPIGETSSFVLGTNLYYNGGAPVPEGPSDAVNPSDDSDGVFADPQLPTDQSGLLLPTWNPVSGLFGDGSARIEDVHRALVDDYATPLMTSPVVDRARSDQVPSIDILGQSRHAGFAELGAVEVGSNTLLFADGFEGSD